MKNRVFSISLVVAFVLSVALIGCGSTEIPEYNLTIASTEGGEVTSPREGTSIYKEGTVVDLVATPDEYCCFANWTGDVGTIANVSDATTTITMQGNYSVTANFEEDEVVTFFDPNLEAVIRQAISEPEGPIYGSDLHELTHLYAGQRSISNLGGLEHCTSLTYLILDNNQISDISPLANLTSLTILYSAYNQISDISFLANLTSLTILYLHDNQISDISPLANLTNLRYLILDDNRISDISPLTDLTSLTFLYLQDNQIGDISPLVQNAGLATGDTVGLEANPLNSDSVSIYIPQLEGRGVEIVW